MPADTKFKILSFIWLDNLRHINIKSALASQFFAHSVLDRPVSRWVTLNIKNVNYMTTREKLVLKYLREVVMLGL
jgi:hypothetical protein